MGGVHKKVSKEIIVITHIKKIAVCAVAFLSLAVLTARADETPSWLTFGGDLRVRHDVLRGHSVAYLQYVPATPMVPATMPAQTFQNNSLLTNRFGLNLKANVAEGVSLKARLVMIKAYGMDSSFPIMSTFFADRYGTVFDGTAGHIANGNMMYVDYAYADVSNIMDYPVWFSAGRRPSTGGAPTNLRQNLEAEGVAGVMGLLTDYAFDGFTLGVAPAFEKLPGFATKLCYGRAYQPTYRDFDSQATLHNTDMLGFVVIPLENENTRVETQYQRGFHIMNTTPGAGVTTNLGDLEDYGVGIMHVLRDVGIGDLNVFAHGAMSKSYANSNTVMGSGLLYTGTPQDREGYAAYLGARYDITKSRTKIGGEFNQGSRYWQNFTPAADDVWTSKLGTRGRVYEGYVIQELFREPTSPKGKVFFRLGYQYYKFKYTGSNNWVGAPIAIDDISTTNPATMQMLTPLKNAYDIYTSFDVHF